MIPPRLLPLLALTLLLAPLISESDRASCLETPELLLNGKKVDDDALICEVLDSCLASGRFFRDPRVEEWARIRNRRCNSDTALPYPAQRRLPPEEYLGKAGRKLLLQLQEEASLADQLTGGLSKLQEEKKDRLSWLPLDDKAIVMPGMFLMCCGVLCPCFRARRKKITEHHPLSRELNSMDSISLEINSASEKTPATPLRVPPSPSRLSLSPQLSRIGSIHLSISQIMKATQSFSPSLKVGEGGFGTVYRGVLPEGHVVAVKRAKRELIPDLRDEFSNEVELLSKIEHRNLVKLLGYNDKGNERIIISEYVPNGTLREHLDGQHGKILDFNQRLEIAIDVAHGLTYLHLYAEKPIIHRDVKSSNILLTESYRAKVSDFGFARVGATDEGQTHIMTKVKGTAGYLDPEYLQTYQLTPKSDVYSFGILLIEILSARRPVEPRRAIDERITVRWAFKMYNEGNLRGMLDPLLEKTVGGEVLSKLVGLAFQCAAPTRADRPTMREVGEQLWEIRKDHGSTHRNN